MRVRDAGTSGGPIEAVYAWLTVDPETGYEGLMGGHLLGIGYVPAVSSELDLLQMLREHAEQLTRMTRYGARLVRFDRAALESIVEIEPLEKGGAT